MSVAKSYKRDFNTGLLDQIVAYWKARGFKVRGRVDYVQDDDGDGRPRQVLCLVTDMKNGLPVGACSKDVFLKGAEHGC